ncbi:type II toxin-antitoxin system Phd/YefM family antitoxin [Pseudomonas sp. UM16]|uniref:type II toxin-antitoxin system Phd/YefM family antitoxin n=1 Tax=Pseudomonas sp. UM16 TaxID=3158962 RepID=UPI00398F9FC9
MHVLTVKQARKKLKQTMDDVCRDHEPTVIVRKRGKPVVLLPLKDYNGFQETMYLLGSTANTQRLKISVARLRSSPPHSSDS